jgi:hypothetical protein
MDLLRDSEGMPKDNMYRALILQAALSGLMMLLCFAFRGRMLRTEAIEKMLQLEAETEKRAESQHQIDDLQDEEQHIDNSRSQ